MNPKKIYYKDGYEYQLTKAYTVQVSIRPVTNIITPWVLLSQSGVLICKEGYAWDGATGAIDTRNFMRGSLVHDALYQLMDLGHLDPDQHRKAADKELKRICREDGMSWLRASWVYRTVRLLGGLFAGESNDSNKEKSAP